MKEEQQIQITSKEEYLGFLSYNIGLINDILRLKRFLNIDFAPLALHRSISFSYFALRIRFLIAHRWCFCGIAFPLPYSLK